MKKLPQLTLAQKKLRKRYLQISHQRKLSHLGSCLSSIDIIDQIYTVKYPEDSFVLSNGHVGYALYTVLEKHQLATIEDNHMYCVHPHRGELEAITVSTGSLGQGLPIAAGIALAEPNQTVYCLISDGESTEGSIWETLRLCADLPISNICIIVNANGWAAYDKINVTKLKKRLKGFGLQVTECNGHDSQELQSKLEEFKNGQFQVLLCHTKINQFPFLKKQDAHYHVMTEKEYQQAQKILEDL